MMWLDIYQHVPSSIHPIVFTIGFFSLHWYALMYILGIFVTTVILWHLLRSRIAFDAFVDFVFDVLLGVIIGARLGYVILYFPEYYLEHPLAIISPFDPITGMWVGIAGMSYYGGCIGAVIGLWRWKKTYDRNYPEKRISFWQLSDIFSLALPFGYFFGRIGNFLNGELFGRITKQSWGMYFENAPSGTLFLRHPSQLYEAFGEGIMLGCFLWCMHKKRKLSAGMISVLYLGGYAGIRFILEFFREPDPQFGFLWTYVTFGQVLSALFLTIAGILYVHIKKSSLVIF